VAKIGDSWFFGVNYPTAGNVKYEMSEVRTKVTDSRLTFRLSRKRLPRDETALV